MIYTATSSGGVTPLIIFSRKTWKIGVICKWWFSQQEMAFRRGILSTSSKRQPLFLLTFVHTFPRNSWRTMFNCCSTPSCSTGKSVQKRSKILGFHMVLRGFNGGTSKSSIWDWDFPLETIHFVVPPFMETSTCSLKNQQRANRWTSIDSSSSSVSPAT